MVCRDDAVVNAIAWPRSLFKQRAVGLAGLTFVVVLYERLLKWQVEAVEKWRPAEPFPLYGLRLVLMAMLVFTPDAISVTFAKPVRRVIPGSVLSAVMA